MNVELSHRAYKSLYKLNVKQQKRINAGIRELYSDPPTGEIVPVYGRRNTFRLRVGEYRVIYYKELCRIVIEDILPRGDAYKKGLKNR